MSDCQPVPERVNARSNNNDEDLQLVELEGLAPEGDKNLPLVHSTLAQTLPL